MSILVQTKIAHFGKPKQSFDDTELMLLPGTSARFISVTGSLFIGQFPVAATFGLGEVLCVWCAVCQDRLLAGVGGVAPHSRLLPMEEVRKNLGIVHIGRGRDHRMNELRAAVDANMSLHPKEPLIALARLAHIRVALLLLVLGGTRCIDDTRINHGAPGYLQAVFLKVLIDQVEQL